MNAKTSGYYGENVYGKMSGVFSYIPKIWSVVNDVWLSCESACITGPGRPPTHPMSPVTLRLTTLYYFLLLHTWYIGVYRCLDAYLYRLYACIYFIGLHGA